MRMSWVMCVLMGTLAWGQAAPAAPPRPESAKPQAPPAPADTSASIPANAAVITVEGICQPQPRTAAKSTAGEKPTAPKSSAADCKTVITKAEFEKLASGVAPNMTPQLKKQLAGVLPRLIAMSEAAQKEGLDKTPQYEEMVKFARMQLLANSLQRHVQEEAAKVPAEDIEQYYNSHPEMYEEATLERLFIPRTRQADADLKDEEERPEKLTDEQRKEKEEGDKERTEQNEQAMTKLAEELRVRAVAGEDFLKLQKEAFEAAGMKIESPTVALPKIRRTGLPAAHAAVFDLNVGDISQVINDSGGHYIYKVTEKDKLTLDQAKDEIHNKLQNDRSREMMDKLNSSYKVETNEAYFGPGGPGMPAPPRVAGPRMAPSPMAPAAQPQTPAAQAPAPAPAARPN
jgi:bifunctional DNA-binding transcriptional regulator/antitoxin component of YhaV-PrlF toxin-antitoxin module